MFDLAKRKLMRQAVRVHNPGERVLTVCLEPWAERYSVGSHETIDVVFVGPRLGGPEILPYSDELMLYGWEGSDVVALQNSRLVAAQPTVREIVAQELEFAKERVRRTNRELPHEQIAWTQQRLDAEPKLTPKSRELVCELAACLTIELAPALERSDAATALLWQVVSRLIATRGLFLAAPDPATKEVAVWEEHPGILQNAIRRQRISALGGRPSRTKLSHRVMRRPSESGSDPTPH